MYSTLVVCVLPKDEKWVRFPLPAHSMSPDNESGAKAEHADPANIEGRVHRTHFSFEKKPLRKTDQESGYEWVKTGENKWKRVPKKEQK